MRHEKRETGRGREGKEGPWTLRTKPTNFLEECIGQTIEWPKPDQAYVASQTLVPSYWPDKVDFH